MLQLLYSTTLVDEIIPKERFRGITFHYLFPDLDGHNHVLMALEKLEERPILVADAGFMYVAKMSGYADFYDLFTPDIGEMAFLADEKAPHPFYTRGFLLAEEDDIPSLLEKAILHNNISKNLIIKGVKDYIVADKSIVSSVSEPSISAMEAIGGTGDLVTGLVSARLIFADDITQSSQIACQRARDVAQIVKPTPATQISEIISHMLV